MLENAGVTYQNSQMENGLMCFYCYPTEELNNLISEPIEPFKDLQFIVARQLLMRESDNSSPDHRENPAIDKAKAICRQMDVIIQPGRIPNNQNFQKFIKLLVVGKNLNEVYKLLYKIVHSDKWHQNLDNYSLDDIKAMNAQMKELVFILRNFENNWTFANPFFMKN